MATGSGKTLTALGSIARLSEDMKDTAAVIIVCPYKHLVDQWVEDIDRFNMSPIIGHSESVQCRKGLLESRKVADGQVIACSSVLSVLVILK